MTLAGLSDAQLHGEIRLTERQLRRLEAEAERRALPPEPEPARDEIRVGDRVRGSHDVEYTVTQRIGHYVWIRRDWEARTSLMVRAERLEKIQKEGE